MLKSCKLALAVLICTAAGTAVAQTAAPAAPVAVIDGVTSETERKALSAWWSEAHRVLATPKFESNLASLGATYPKIYLRTDNGAKLYGTVHDLKAIVRRTAANHRFIRTPLAAYGYAGFQLEQEDGANNAFTGYTGYSDNGEPQGSMTLGRKHLARWLSKDDVQRSCAINTLAHEISHTISTDAKYYNYALMDEDPSAETVVGSYLIGSVAQCTWLQERGALSEVGFPACIQTFAVNTFANGMCPTYKPTNP
jgi:hypothetical protein